jgi:hypothetical protein
VGCVITDDFGIATIDLKGFGTFNVCVDPATLPAGATLNSLRKKLRVDTVEFPEPVFELGGDFCSTPPPPGGCWLTGGGTSARARVYRTSASAESFTRGAVLKPRMAETGMAEEVGAVRGQGEPEQKAQALRLFQAVARR